MITTSYIFKGAGVRVAATESGPVFVAADICRILDYTNPTQTLGRLDEDERTLISIEGASNGLQVNAVTESGLYSLILGSRKPEARAFKKWVTSEVLPSIRQTGTYSVPAAPRHQLPSTLPEALRFAADLEEKRAALALELEDARPKLEYHARVMSSDSLFGFREVAALLAEKGIGSTNLVRRLEEMGILYHEKRGEKKGHVLAKAQYISAGYFRAIERAYEVKETGGVPTGETRISATLKVTVSGVEFIARKLDEGKEAT